MALNYFLIVLMVIIPLILLALNIYIMVYFQHPEEIGVNWIWRILIILSFELCELAVLLIPADVMNAGPPYGGIPMEIIWYIVYYTLIAMVMFILPFGLCWHNQDQEDKFGRKLFFALLFTVAFLVVVIVFSLVLYLIFGVAEVPVVEAHGKIDWETEIDEIVFDIGLETYSPDVLFNTKVPTENNVEVISFRISWILFLIAGVSTIGDFLVIVFGGIGFGILPVKLIFSFVNRPQPIKDADKKKYMKIIGEKALKMLDESKRIKMMSGIRHRRAFSKFREEVYILDRALRTLNKRANLKGFLWGYIALILGILACIASLLWCAQLILSMFEVPYALFDFVMSWMTGSLSFFGIIFYAIFALYLFFAAFKAVEYIGFRFGLGFAFYPFEVSNTYMNAFCFNAMLLSFIAFGVNTFCSEVFTSFIMGTSVQQFMGNSISELRYIKYIYQYGPIIMPILAGIFAGFMLLSKLCCKHPKEKDDLEILLEREHVKNETL